MHLLGVIEFEKGRLVVSQVLPIRYREHREGLRVLRVGLCALIWNKSLLILPYNHELV